MRQFRISQSAEKIIRSSFSLLLTRILTGLMPLLITPLCLGYLGLERYGMWMASTSIISFLALAEGGMSGALVTSLSTANGAKNQKLVKSLIATSLVLMFILGTTLAVLSAFIVPLVPWTETLKLTSDLAAAEVKSLVLVVCLSVSLGFIANAGVRIQQGLSFIPRASTWEALASVSTLPALYLAILLQLGSPWLAASSLIVPHIVRLIGFTIFVSGLLEVPRLSDFCVKSATTLFVNTRMFLVSGLANAASVASDQLLIAYVLGADQVSLYSIFFKYYSIPFMLAAIIQTALWPEFSKALAMGRLEWVRVTFYRSLIVIALSSILSTSFLFQFEDDFITRWLGKSMDAPSDLSWGMAAYAILSVLVSAFLHLSYSLNNQVEQMKISLCMMFMNIFASVILIHAWGISGVIIGTDIAYLIGFIVPYAFLLPKLLPVARGT